MASSCRCRSDRASCRRRVATWSASAGRDLRCHGHPGHRARHHIRLGLGMPPAAPSSPATPFGLSATAEFRHGPRSGLNPARPPTPVCGSSHAALHPSIRRMLSAAPPDAAPNATRASGDDGRLSLEGFCDADPTPWWRSHPAPLHGGLGTAAIRRDLTALLRWARRARALHAEAQRRCRPCLSHGHRAQCRAWASLLGAGARRRPIGLHAATQQYGESRQQQSANHGSASRPVPASARRCRPGAGAGDDAAMPRAQSRRSATIQDPGARHGRDQMGQQQWRRWRTGSTR